MLSCPGRAGPQMMGVEFIWVFVFPTAHLYLQRDEILRAGFLEVGLLGHGVQTFLILIDTAKLLFRKDVAVHSCRQHVNVCLSTFQPMADTGWCQSLTFLLSGCCGGSGRESPCCFNSHDSGF